MDASVDAYPATEVRAELNRILSSSNFVTSDRNRRFLEHVIEETLAGRGDRLKAYNIATIVFGRPANFDAQLDPVVRMEAGRVRRALERFYLIEGQPGVLRISIPKGGYQPQFSSPATMAVERTGLELAKTRAVFVSQFEAGGTAAPHNLNVGFTPPIHGSPSPIGTRGCRGAADRSYGSHPHWASRTLCRRSERDGTADGSEGARIVGRLSEDIRFGWPDHRRDP